MRRPADQNFCHIFANNSHTWRQDAMLLARRLQERRKEPSVESRLAKWSAWLHLNQLITCLWNENKIRAVTLNFPASLPSHVRTRSSRSVHDASSERPQLLASEHRTLGLNRTETYTWRCLASQSLKLELCPAIATSGDGCACAALNDLLSALRDNRRALRVTQVVW